MTTIEKETAENLLSRAWFGYMRQAGIDAKAFTVVVEEWVKKTFPETTFNDSERAVFVANYKRDLLDTAVLLNWEQFTLGLRILNVQVKMILAPFQENPVSEEKPVSKEKKQGYPEVWNEEIAFLNLPVRALNVLRANGYFYVGDLVRLSRAELLRLPSVGATIANAVEFGLHQHMFTLDTDNSNWNAPHDHRLMVDLNKTVDILNIESAYIRRLHKADIKHIGTLIQRRSSDLASLKFPMSVVLIIIEQLRTMDLKLGTKLKKWVAPK